ncbi:hypothetical protein RUM43_012577 [Polyplax serrata]|uniref:Uncharacterized protein n=1 Tax=Polyplax serrata TaxID=468196 RepID=A0AAN8PJB7_POLSC
MEQVRTLTKKKEIMGEKDKERENGEENGRKKDREEPPPGQRTPKKAYLSSFRWQISAKEVTQTGDLVILGVKLDRLKSNSNGSVYVVAYVKRVQEGSKQDEVELIKNISDLVCFACQAKQEGSEYFARHGYLTEYLEQHITEEYDMYGKNENDRPDVGEKLLNRLSGEGMRAA